jgi:tetratricopeptide (TPR) repeat protein
MARYYSRDYAGALTYFDSMGDLDRSAASKASGGLVTVYEQQGEYAQALKQWRKLLASSGDDQRATTLARAYTSSGSQGYWRERVKLLPKEVSAFEAAAVYARAGDKPAAIDALNRAYEQHSPWLNFIAADPAFDAIRSDPRFRKLLQRLRL